MPGKLTMHSKAKLYDKVVMIVEDRIALEKYFRSVGKDDSNAIDSIRADSYGAIVNLVIGHHALPRLPISKQANTSS
jgi:hypothetical protein